MTAFGLTSLADLLMGYAIEADWLLAWFPIRSAAGLEEVRIRNGRFRHRNTDAVFTSGNQEVHIVGQGGGGAAGDPLIVTNAVRAFITIGVTADRTFEAELEVVLGRSRRRQRLVLRPDTRAPFMINLPATGSDPTVQGTAVCFQGVFAAGHRLGLLGAVTRLIGP